MNFQSFYWEGAPVPAAEHSTLEELEDTESPVSRQKAALVHLLGSDSVVTRGIALDFYSLSNANLRHGDEPMIDAEVDAAARACALRELAAPPYDRVEASARPRRGANHASALRTLWFNADPADAPLVARVLLENQDDRVLAQGVGAAEPIPRGEPAHPALVDALSQLVRRHSLEPSTRAGSDRCDRRLGGRGGGAAAHRSGARPRARGVRRSGARPARARPRTPPAARRTSRSGVAHQRIPAVRRSRSAPTARGGVGRREDGRQTTSCRGAAGSPADSKVALAITNATSPVSSRMRCADDNA